MSRARKRAIMGLLVLAIVIVAYNALHPSASSAAADNSVYVDPVTGAMTYLAGSYVGNDGLHVEAYSPAAGTVYLRTSANNVSPLNPGYNCQATTQIPGGYMVPGNPSSSIVVCTGVTSLNLDLSGASSSSGNPRVAVTAPISTLSSVTITPGALNFTVLAAPSRAVIQGGSGNGYTYLTPFAYGPAYYAPTNLEIHGGGGADTVDLMGVVSNATPAAPTAVTLDNVANDGAAGSHINIRSDINNIIGTDYPWAASTIDASGATGPVKITGPTSGTAKYMDYANVVVSGPYADTIKLYEGHITGNTGTDVGNSLTKPYP